MNRELGIRSTVFVGVSAYVALWAVALAAYRLLLPGVPDAGPVVVSLLPSLLFFFLASADLLIFAVWFAACSVFFVPPLLMSFLAVDRRTRLLSVGIFFLANAYGGWEIWSSRMLYFAERSYTLEAGLRAFARDFSFLLALSALGFFVGIWARRKRHISTAPLLRK